MQTNKIKIPIIPTNNETGLPLNTSSPIWGSMTGSLACLQEINTDHKYGDILTRSEPAQSQLLIKPDQHLQLFVWKILLTLNLNILTIFFIFFVDSSYKVKLIS